MINFTGDYLHITPTSTPHAYFIWDEKTLFYTPNDGYIVSEVISHGCQFDYLNNMNEYELRNYYKNLDVDYDNITLLTQQIYCLNKTIDYIFVSNNEFFILTKTRKIKILIIPKDLLF